MAGLRPVEMQKVRIFALRSILTQLIADLHKAGVMEIKKEKFTGLEDGRPLEFFNVVSEQLVKVRAINAMLEKYSGRKDFAEPKRLDVEEAIRLSKELGIEKKLKSLTAQVSAKESEISKLKEKLAVVGSLLPFKGIDFSKLETRTVSFRVGEYPSEKLDFLKGILDKEFDVYNLISPTESPTTLLMFKKTDKNVDQILSNSGFSIVEIPEETTTANKTKKALENGLREAESDLQKSRKELLALADSNIEKIKDIIHSLKIEADRAEIASRFGFSKSMVAFEGWIIKKEVPEIKKVVERFKDRALLEELPITHDEVPPTILGNPKIATPFEFLTKNYSLPNYFELDPSMIYLIALPIIYGMIVGDVLYGVLSIFIAKWLMKKFEKSDIMTNVSRIWYYSAFPTMIWGVLFDEWGGASHSFWLKEFGILTTPLYTGFHRLHGMAMLIAFTAIVGILHLTLGFIMGAINHWNHDKKHSFAKISWIGVLYGGTFAISSMMFGVFPEAVGLAGFGLLILSAIALVFTEGMIGILELPGLLGNVLSYARIAAVGVAGVAIAELVNGAFAPVPKAGLMAFLFLPLFLGLHLMNCFVAMFEALIQGGRLNIVEFRSKFLEGGGKVFLPFSMHLKNK